MTERPHPLKPVPARPYPWLRTAALAVVFLVFATVMRTSPAARDGIYVALFQPVIAALVELYEGASDEAGSTRP